MFLFCNEDRKKKERLNSLLQTTRNLIKNNEIKDVRKNPVYSLIRAMSNYHLYDIVRELYEDEEVTDMILYQHMIICILMVYILEIKLMMRNYIR